MSTALVIGDSRLRPVKQYIEKNKPEGLNYLHVHSHPGATLQDIFKYTGQILEKNCYSLVYILAIHQLVIRVNNYTRMTGKAIVINETFLLQMPTILISECQLF